MFGATFVFPLVMGLDPNLAIMFAGICDDLFLLIVQGRVPSYLGTSASFVGGVAAICAQGGDSADVTGAILVAGVVLARRSASSSTSSAPDVIHKVLPPVVTGAVVMLIGFNLAPRRGQHLLAAGPVDGADHHAAVILMAAVLLPGSSAGSRSSSALIFGYLLSWLFDAIFGGIDSVDPALGDARRPTTTGSGLGQRVERRLVGLPERDARRRRRTSAGTCPSFSLTFILLVLPGGHRADRREHRPRQGGRRDDRRGPRPRTWAGPSPPTASPPCSRRRVRRLADHDVRREHRRHGAPRGSTRRRPTSWPAAVAILLGLRARSSARSSTPPRAGSSAASRSCSTG